MITKELIIHTVKDILRGSDLFLVEATLQSVGKITIYIDGDKGVSIKDCEDLSRQIESRIPKDKEDYELTVSSAGMERPLLLKRQYNRRIGKQMEIVLHNGIKLNGILVKLHEAAIELEHPVANPKKEKKKENSVVEFKLIKSVKQSITFKNL